MRALSHAKKGAYMYMQFRRIFGRLAPITWMHARLIEGLSKMESNMLL